MILLTAVVLLASAAALLFGRHWLQAKQTRDALDAAEALYTAGDYEAAQNAFTALGLTERAEDCGAQLLRLRYEAAEKLLEDGEFLDARDAFRALGDYADAADRAIECELRRAERYRDEARWGEAISLLESLGTPEAGALAESCREALYEMALEATYACRMDEAVSLWTQLGD